MFIKHPTDHLQLKFCLRHEATKTSGSGLLLRELGWVREKGRKGDTERRPPGHGEESKAPWRRKHLR